MGCSVGTLSLQPAWTTGPRNVPYRTSGLTETWPRYDTKLSLQRASVTVVHQRTQSVSVALKGGGVTCMKAVQWVQYYDCVGALEVASRGPIQGSGLLNDGI